MNFIFWLCARQIAVIRELSPTRLRLPDSCGVDADELGPGPSDPSEASEQQNSSFHENFATRHRWVYEFLVQEAVVVLGNVPKLLGLIGSSLLLATGALPSGCSDDRFSGCEASRTCPPPSKGGEAGAAGGSTETGGSSGSGSPGRGGTGTDDGGESGAPSSGGTAAGGGAGASGEAEGGEGGSAEPPDTTPPSIISVSPADGALGVRGDTNIVVTFSEPMDRVTTQAAYQSPDVPAAGVTFSWNASSTVLTVNPIADLPYAEGTASSSPATQFAISVTDTAEDLAGNRLSPDDTWSFSTLRRIAQTVTSSGYWMVDHRSSAEGCEDNVEVGDYGYDDLLAVLAFDLTDVPAGIVDWESAVFAGTQEGVEGTPYGSQGLGVIRAYAMGAAVPSSITFATPFVLDLGVFSAAPGAGVRMIDAFDAVTADYADRINRGHRSVYRLSFERSRVRPADIDRALFDCTFTLTLGYLVP
jgi:hypothetical protein